MSANSLKIVPAGAGSGKTHRIMTDLVSWVRSGDVRPDRIMAVTFTEAAASELIDRIRGALLEEGMVEAALDLERAYISTIHGLGLRLLTEHAFAAGASPNPRHLSEAERDLLIRQEIARCTELDPVKEDLLRFGYGDRYGASAEEGFRGSVSSAITLLRGLGEAGLKTDLVGDAVSSLRSEYGTVVADGKPLKDRLKGRVNALLNAYPQGGTPYAGPTKAAKESFRNQLAALRRARDTNDLDRDWSLWVKLGELRLKAQKSVLPEDFVTLSQDVITAAGAIDRHPGPLEDACRNLETLITGAQSIMVGYRDRKRSAGVIDFADMVADAEALVRHHPSVLDAVLADVDCVIVDEFQDTNPVQFALIWRIAEAASRTLLVGDTKQSIMGFQGADPRLTEALVSTFPDRAVALDRNWRTDPRLMDFINGVSGALFGENYVPLKPQRASTGYTSLEILRTPVSRVSRSPKARPDHHMASRIKALLDEGAVVIDRASAIDAPKERRVRPGDIAVLCKTHSQASRYAQRLEELGIPVRINGAGWYGSPPILAVRYALAFASDPNDVHAALCFLTLGPPELDLQEAMEALASGELDDLEALSPLRDLSEIAAETPLAVFGAKVIEAAGVRAWLNEQYDPRQLRADLLRFEAEIADFETSHRDMTAAAGFYGNTAQVFLGWLASRVDDRDFDRRPDPTSGAADGVEIVTWHASKGREWNIVCLACIDDKIAARPGVLHAHFEDFDDLNDVLGRVALRYTPVLPIKEKQESFLSNRQNAVEADARRLLYVAMTRARDRLIIEWPDCHLEKSKADLGPQSYAEILTKACTVDLRTNEVSVGKTSFPARITRFSEDIPPEFEKRHSSETAGLLVLGVPRAGKETKRSPWRVRPSEALAAKAEAADVKIVDLGAPVPVDAEHWATASDRGTAWHKVMRSALVRPDLVDKAQRSANVLPETVEAISKQAEAIRSWFDKMGYDRLHAELPLQVERADGAQINALVDLMAEGESGLFIVDHKTRSASDPAKTYAAYRPQLQAYADAARAVSPDKPVHGVAINFMRDGVLVWEPIAP